ncbi:MAG TPA: serine/threonine-protein kinase, partial [Kofleriaceae bacterium]|nr:serine/threonine-protein kinase [Kofleriaceae bacterium]
MHGVVHRAFSISGRYDVGELLAVSAAAFVFGADDRTSRRSVAIKILRSERAESPWEIATPLPRPAKRASQREFQQAAATLAGLPAEHATEILNVGHDDALGVTYVVIDRQGPGAAALEAHAWAIGSGAHAEVPADADGDLDHQVTAAMAAVHPPSDDGHAAGSVLDQLDRMAAPPMIGSYRVVRELGAGGTDRVYLGEHPVIHTQVAIKVLLPDIARQRDTVERFMQEARASGQIGSLHIPRYFDFGTTPSGLPYAVMEYFEGETLGRRLLRVGTLSVEETAHIIDQVASAMQMAHDAGLIHRDLKPENIFLVEPTHAPGRLRATNTASMTAIDDAPLPDVKLLDFGIAKVVGRRSAAQTQNGAFLGTPFYCAPEQVFGQEVDARTDVYSLGATAFEMLTGTPPFTGEVPEILSAKATEDPPDPRTYGVPDVVAATVRTMLARDPTHRAPSMAWVRSQIARWTRPGGVESRPPLDEPRASETTGAGRAVRNPDESIRLGRADTALPEAGADDAGDDAVPPRASRGMRWLIGGGLAVAAVLTVVLISGLGRGTRTESHPPARVAPAAPPVVVPAPVTVPAPPSSTAAVTPPTAPPSPPSTAAVTPPVTPVPQDVAPSTPPPTAPAPA